MTMRDPFVHIKQSVAAIMKIPHDIREPCKALFESMLLAAEAEEREEVDQINGVIAKHIADQPETPQA